MIAGRRHEASFARMRASLMDVLETKIATTDERFLENSAHLVSIVGQLKARQARVQAGGGEAALEKHRRRVQSLRFNRLKTRPNISSRAGARCAVFGRAIPAASLPRRRLVSARMPLKQPMNAGRVGQGFVNEKNMSRRQHGVGPYHETTARSLVRRDLATILVASPSALADILIEQQAL